MPEGKDLKQKLDVISYVVAGVLSIVILSYPFLKSGDAAVQAENIQGNLKDKLDDKITKANSELAPQVPQWASDLDGMWRVGSVGEEKAVWVTESKPASLRLWNDVPPPVAVHQPGGVVSIELVRDVQKKKPFLRIIGKVSAKNQHIEIEELILEKKVGEGEYKRVEDFVAVGDFLYEDTDVVPGLNYGYRFVSIAVPAGVEEGLHEPILEADARVRVSNELVTELPVPRDLMVKVRSYADELTVPKLVGQIVYWDYSVAKTVVKKNRGMQEEWVRGFIFGEDYNGKPRYSIRFVRPLAGSPLHGVTINDWLTGEKLTFKKELEDPPSIDSWGPVVSEFEAPEKPPETEGGKNTGTGKSTGKPSSKPTGKPTGKPVAKKPAGKSASTEKKGTSGEKAKPASGKPKKPGARKRAGFE